MDRDRVARAIPVLSRFADRVVGLADEVLSQRVKCDVDSDHLGFMGLCFLAEQRNHLQAIRCLASSGLGRTSGLIARAMVEGLALLRWAEGDSERAERWRVFAYIVDFRTMMKDLEAGRQVERNTQARIAQMLEVHGEQFLSPKAKKACRDGKPLPNDPYVRQWYEPSIRDIFRYVKGEQLYEHIYRAESEKAHWSVSSLGRNVRPAGRGVIYAGDTSPEDIATASAVGFQALLETLQDVDAHLNLGKGKAIENLKQEYIRSVT